MWLIISILIIFIIVCLFALCKASSINSRFQELRELQIQMGELNDEDID